MFSILLKKALPFALTLAAGTALGWLFKPAPPAAWTWPEDSTPALGREGPFGEPRGRGRGHCRMRPHYLVAETRPLVILFKPDARYPFGREFVGGDVGSARVSVAFGADGEVKAVKPVESWFDGRDEDPGRVKAMWEAVEGAARRIRFTPQLVDSVPVTVESEVEIHFIAD